MKKSRLIRGTLQATLEASRAVEELQNIKLSKGNEPDFCYLENVEDNWLELVGEGVDRRERSRSERFQQA